LILDAVGPIVYTIFMRRTQVKTKVQLRKVMIPPKDSPRDVRMQQAIRSRANFSLAILGQAFVRNGSGRFLNIRCTEEPLSSSVDNEELIDEQPICEAVRH